MLSGSDRTMVRSNDGQGEDVAGDERPSWRRASREQVATAAGLRPQSIHDFYSAKRERSFGLGTLESVLTALTETGYEYAPRPRPGLRGKAVLYELPRLWPFDAVLPGFDDAHLDLVHTNPVWSALTAGLSRAAGQHGARLEVFTNLAALNLPPRFPATERFLELGRAYVAATATHPYEAAVRDRPAKALAGFVLTDPTRNDPRIGWLLGSGVPFVVLGRPPDAPAGVMQVDIDDEWGFAQLVIELVDQGVARDRIGHVAFQDDGTGPPARRRRGVLRGLGLASAPARRKGMRRTAGGVDAVTFEIPYDEPFDEDQLALLRGWLKGNRWQAVVADCDRFASYVAAAAAEEGLEVSVTPGLGRIVLAGCDDGPERRASPVAWMTLRTPVMAWTSTAMDLLGQQQPERRRPGVGDPAVHLVRPTVVGAAQHGRGSGDEQAGDMSSDD